MTVRNRNLLLIALAMAVALAGLFAYSAMEGVGRYGTTESSVGRSSGGLGVAPSEPSGVPAMDDSYGREADKSIFYPQPMPPTAGETAAEVDQKIIKNGSLYLVVDDVSASAEKLTALAKRRGGFVQRSEISERADGTKYGSVTFRVPVAEFEAAMTESKDGAREVKNDTSTGQDVTEQFSDLQAQLRNARAQEETYLQVLKQAKTVQDILQVQQYLGNIRGQIESLEGRIKYLENMTSFSTISVTLEEEPSVNVPTKEFRPVSAAKEAVQALVTVAQDLVIALIWLAIVGGGIGIPLLLVAWLIVRLVIKMAGGKPGRR